METAKHKKINQKIYEAILKSFPKTNKQSASDYAIQGGIKFQFNPK